MLLFLCTWCRSARYFERALFFFQLSWPIVVRERKRKRGSCLRLPISKIFVCSSVWNGPQQNWMFTKRLRLYIYIYIGKNISFFWYISGLDQHININIIHIRGRFMCQQHTDGRSFLSLDLPLPDDETRMRNRNTNNYLIEWFLLRQK